MHLPPESIHIELLHFDDNPIGKEREYGVTEDAAKQFIANKKASVNKRKGEFENYYSAEGCASVNKKTGNIRTAYKENEFTDSVKAMREVLKKYGG